jgi:acetoin utilization protein AcuB
MSRHVVTVSMDATVKEIQRIFAQFRFHHVVVTEEEQPDADAGVRAVGIISDRDLLKAISPFIGKMAERPQDVASLGRKAHQIMTRELVWTTQDVPIADAALVMLNRRVTCLPVLDAEGRCVGIATWRDLLRWTVQQGVACGRSSRDAA